MYNFAVIGGGIVGLSVAWQLRQRRPSDSIVVIEKEQAVARHQTGHNSGVIHAGIYYEPGSLKADFCRRGVRATVRFCKDNDIPYEQCGKLIVATGRVCDTPSTSTTIFSSSDDTRVPRKRRRPSMGKRICTFTVSPVNL